MATPAMAAPATGAPLRYLYPGWYAVVMGLTGLALAWHRAEPAMGALAAGVARALAALAAVVFAVLAVATVLRALRHADAWREDRQHPVRHTFVATLPVAVMLVATVGVALLGPHTLTALLWWAGSLGQLAVTVWVLGRWWAPSGRTGPVWAGVTPALFIPVVGNVLAPLGGVPLGHAGWAAAQFGIGLLFWPVVLVLMMVRIAQHGPWPERLRPTSFIVIAPPAVVGLGALQLGAAESVAWMCWGMALFGLLWVGTQWRALAAVPFGLPHWAMSFPLAALAALTLRLAAPGSMMLMFAVALLALASIVVLGLALATWRGLSEGALLVREPAPRPPLASP